MQPLDRSLGWYTNSADEQLRAILDCDFDEIVELSMCVVMVRLSCATTDLWKREVDTERQVLVSKV